MGQNVFKPRILMINSARKWIGEAAHTIMLVEGLRARGIPVVLVCRKDFALHQKAKEKNIPFYNLTMKGNFNGVNDLLDLTALRRIIKEHQIDIIHAHRGKDHWYSACVRLLPGLPARPFVIRTRHVTVPVKNHIFNRWLYQKGTDSVIAVSQKAAESLQGVPMKNNPAVIYAAVDTARFTPEKRSDEMRRACGISNVAPDAPLIGLVARFQRVKGQAVLLEAIPKILQFLPDARFVFAGQGKEGNRQTLIQKVQESNISNRVQILGFLPDIETLIASLDAGVVASLGSEGSSRITMEYMASGVPVIATSVGGIPELLECGRLGRSVEPNNAEELARGIIETLLAPHASREKARLALEKARSSLNSDRFISETLSEYQKVMWKS